MATNARNDAGMNFPATELTRLLGRDIVPSRLREAYNTVRGDRYMERLIAANKEEILLGSEANGKKKWNQIADGQDYFRVSSGFVPFKDVLCLAIGSGVERGINAGHMAVRIDAGGDDWSNRWSTQVRSRRASGRSREDLGQL